jgi:hypothetical protein
VYFAGPLIAAYRGHAEYHGFVQTRGSYLDGISYAFPYQHRHFAASNWHSERSLATPPCLRQSGLAKICEPEHFMNDHYLEELFAEKIRLALKNLSRDDLLRTVQEYHGNPGSSMMLILNFDESHAEAELSVMSPQKR